MKAPKAAKTRGRATPRGESKKQSDAGRERPIRAKDRQNDHTARKEPPASARAILPERPLPKGYEGRKDHAPSRRRQYSGRTAGTEHKRYQKNQGPRAPEKKTVLAIFRSFAKEDIGQEISVAPRQRGTPPPRRGGKHRPHAVRRLGKRNFRRDRPPCERPKGASKSGVRLGPTCLAGAETSDKSERSWGRRRSRTGSFHRAVFFRRVSLRTSKKAPQANSRRAAEMAADYLAVPPSESVGDVLFHVSCRKFSSSWEN